MEDVGGKSVDRLHRIHLITHTSSQLNVCGLHTQMSLCKYNFLRCVNDNHFIL
jgi:hypothetical protein